MTIRKEIIKLLCTGEWTAKDISQAKHIPEKEVYVHLEHISRSLRGEFGIRPAECLGCGFKFSKKRNVRSPSRCPICKSEHIQDPTFYCKTSNSRR
jgi:hypothetical protein